MKKVPFTALLVGLILLGGVAMAQTWTNNATSDPTASHSVQVILPTVLAMALVGDGSTSTTASDVVFTLTASNFMTAMGTTIKPDANNFQDLQAYTNAVNGATITTTVTDPVNNADTQAVLGNISVDANGTWTPLASDVTLSVARGAIRTVLGHDDFQFHVDPALQPGNYTYTVLYTMTAN